MITEGIMTPHEQLEASMRNSIGCTANTRTCRGFCGLPSTHLIGCSKWKWEQHGWTVTDQQVCGIMNGNERERRTALLSILKERKIESIEFVADADNLEVLPLSDVA